MKQFNIYVFNNNNLRWVNLILVCLVTIKEKFFALFKSFFGCLDICKQITVFVKMFIWKCVWIILLSLILTQNYILVFEWRTERETIITSTAANSPLVNVERVMTDKKNSHFKNSHFKIKFSLYKYKEVINNKSDPLILEYD